MTALMLRGRLPNEAKMLEQIRNPVAPQIDAAIKQAIVYKPYRK